MKIAIPSKGRVGIMTTHKLFNKDVYIFVEPQEFGLYSEAYPNLNIVDIKQNDQGVAYVRNFILDYFADEDYLFVLDDDIKQFLYKSKYILLDVMSKALEIQGIMELENCGQAGFGNFDDLRMTKNSFDFNKKIIVNSIFDMRLVKKYNIRYDNTLKVFEDVDITLQFLKNGVRTLLYNGVGYKTDGFKLRKAGKQIGGCKNDWTLANSVRGYEILRDRYGDDIIDKKVSPEGTYRLKIQRAKAFKKFKTPGK